MKFNKLERGDRKRDSPYFFAHCVTVNQGSLDVKSHKFPNKGMGVGPGGNGAGYLYFLCFNHQTKSKKPMKTRATTSEVMVRCREHSLFS